MSQRKKQVALQDGMIVYGVGLKTIVKYYVKHIKEKNAYKFTLDIQNGRVASFTIFVDFFIEGETLYRHGYKIFSYKNHWEQQYQARVVKHNLVKNLKKIETITKRMNKMNVEKMILLSKVLDNMFEAAASVDRSLKKSLKAIR